MCYELNTNLKISRHMFDMFALSLPTQILSLSRCYATLNMILLAIAYMATASVLHSFLESIPTTSLNASLRNFNTWCVSGCNRTLQKFLDTGPPKIWRAKNYQFSTTLQLNGKLWGPV